MNGYELGNLYQQAHNRMRDIDGLLPQEAFDELLKIMLYMQTRGDHFRAASQPTTLALDNRSGIDVPSLVRELRTGFSATSRTSAEIAKPWHGSEMNLSDEALAEVALLFRDVDFSSLGIDARAAALRSFLSPETRRGLGIFLTPDEVARMMVSVVDPAPDAVVLDPACGSGTFLLEVVRHWRSRSESRQDYPYRVWGSDKSARMLLLAQLNLRHSREIVFLSRLLDFIVPNGPSVEAGEWLQPNSVDVIFTNPPFGVTVDGRSLAGLDYRSARQRGKVRKTVPSEVLFVERCLHMLKPGGTLAIVLPQSVLSNNQLAEARQAIGDQGHLTAVVALPPETFAVSGTQATTSAVFFRKHAGEASADMRVSVPVLRLSNVGHDATGRERAGNELPGVPALLRRMSDSQGDSEGRPGRQVVTFTTARHSLADLWRQLRDNSSSHSSAMKLGDVLALAHTGSTPARSRYTDSGLFLVKVGNLSGRGIDWSPRQRNFVNEVEARKRERAVRPMMLEPGDIVLTASAHSPVYIARKVDIVTCIPEFIGGRASFVTEVMRLRLKPDTLDPLALLAYLRTPYAVSRLQQMIRGQTAHLLPQDVMELEVPDLLLRSNDDLSELRRTLREQGIVAERMNLLTHAAAQLLAELQRLVTLNRTD
ncbi:MAG TPA: N-6 DNA methylase [Anaerolineae bacterium]|nr:N-6 DNA methylase [Anaerolineae bacterium]